MDTLYFDEHRALQEEFGTTRLADMLDQKWAHRDLSPEEQAFIASRDMFWRPSIRTACRPSPTRAGRSAS